MMRNFITDLLDNRPGGASFYVIRYTFHTFLLQSTNFYWKECDKICITTVNYNHELLFKVCQYFIELWLRKPRSLVLYKLLTETTARGDYSSLSTWWRIGLNRPCLCTNSCSTYRSRSRVDGCPGGTASQNVTRWCDSTQEVTVLGFIVTYLFTSCVKGQVLYRYQVV